MSATAPRLLAAAHGVICPVAEHKFHPDRRWRFDYAWPSILVALEVEGGVWSGGRHTRGSGFLRDMEKYNAAAGLGWRIVRCVPTDLLRKSTGDALRAALNYSVRTQS
jgi:hypothetical protein